MSGSRAEHEFAALSRRQLMRASSAGLAGLALNVLARENSVTAEDHDSSPQPRPGKPHIQPRAKAVIYLSMSGGPSQVDTFDYKPVLQKNDGKAAEEVGGGTASRLARKGKLWASPWKCSRHGESGLHISELFPRVAGHADDAGGRGEQYPRRLRNGVSHAVVTS
ncbi:MAG: DUF1501 domain-containing protein [Planctomycetales bacterium]